MFAAEAVSRGGIPIVEVTMTVPEAVDVICHLVQKGPGIVGAGSILDTRMARQCLKAGARFLSTEGADLEVIRFATEEEIVVLPGALTPTEVLAAWKSGADFVKVFPCSQVGGPVYIKALTSAMPRVPMIAAGGVNQQNASAFIMAGALALGIGGDLIPREAIHLRQSDRIVELARRFLGFVREARGQIAEGS